MNKINLTQQLKRKLSPFWVIAVLCKQFGDTGKGKIVDLIAATADIIIRCTGGENAGHSIVIRCILYVFHLIPSGILRDKDGKVNIIGNGVYINPKTLIKEINILIRKKVSYNNLMVALNAKLVLPHHILLDRIKEAVAGKNKIGSTGKGMAEACGDHVLRLGLVMNDLLNPSVFRRKLERVLNIKIKLLKTYDKQLVKKILFHNDLGKGRFWDEKNILNIDEIVTVYMQYGQKLKNLIKDTDAYVQANLGKKRILLEGAQGDLLSINYGTYPFVTSTDCTIHGLAPGAGLKVSDIGKFGIDLGIAKIPMSRVGEGPFVTEMGGEKSAIWCREKKKRSEKKYKHISVNDPDEFLAGIAARIKGGEYGATTKRLRRMGHFDLPLLRHSLKLSISKQLILTKLDVLNKKKIIFICCWYRYKGPEYRHGETILREGDIINTAIMEPEVMKYCEPRYTGFPGWQRSLNPCQNFRSLPKELKTIIHYIEVQTRSHIFMVSIGADRNKTILC